MVYSDAFDFINPPVHSCWFALISVLPRCVWDLFSGLRPSVYDCRHTPTLRVMCMHGFFLRTPTPRSKLDGIVYSLKPSVCTCVCLCAIMDGRMCMCVLCMLITPHPPAVASVCGMNVSSVGATCVIADVPLLTHCHRCSPDYKQVSSTPTSSASRRTKKCVARVRPAAWERSTPVHPVPRPDRATWAVSRSRHTASLVQQCDQSATRTRPPVHNRPMPAHATHRSPRVRSCVIAPAVGRTNVIL